MKKHKKLISIFLTIALCLGVTSSLVGCDTNDISLNDNLNFECEDTENIKLSSSSVSVVSEGEDVYLEKILTATVLPATAPDSDKLVDWSISWIDSSNEKVSDYLQIFPNSDGSNICHVRCYKPFTTQAIITVETRVGGYVADCVVTYVGKPTDITITTDAPYVSDSYVLGVNGTYTFNATPINIFNSLGEDCKELMVEIKGVGDIMVGDYEYIDGTSKWYEETVHKVSLDSIKESLISIDFTNNVLSVTPLKSIETYYASMQRIDGGRSRQYTDKFKEFCNDCYFRIDISSVSSGVTRAFFVRFDDSSVTSVNLTDNLEF